MVSSRAAIPPRKLIGFGLIVGSATLLAYFLFLFEPAFLFEIESRVWDWRSRHTAEPLRADQNIKIILIDQASLDSFANTESINWPWPREFYLRVIQFLKRGGAKGVALDMLFTEASSWGVKDDELLAQAARLDLPVVFALVFQHSASAASKAQRKTFLRKQFETTMQTGFEHIFLGPYSPRLNHALLPVSPLIEAGTHFGNVKADPDNDGIFRHYIPGMYFDNLPVLNLPFSLYTATQQQNESKKYTSLTPFLDRKGQLTIRFHGGENTYPTFRIEPILRSFAALESGEEPIIKPETFKNSLVFLGSGAPGLFDSRPTPVAKVYRGVEFNATVLDNLIHGDFIRPVGSWANMSFTILAIVLASTCCLFVRQAKFQLLLLLMFSGTIAFVGLATAAGGYWLNLTVPTICVLTSVIVSLGFQYQLEGREHRFIKNAFRHYLSGSVIDEIVKNPARLSLGGERKELSIFFSDIAGFTTISETVDAEDLVLLLNDYLSAMTDIILESGGTLDKYIGDAIVAFWNAPLPTSDHALQAVTAALRCHETLGKLSKAFELRFKVDIKVRIGLNTGRAVVGNFGSKKRFDYTAVGDAMNTASRLEGANKFFGTSILLADQTRIELNGQIHCRNVGLLQLVGKSSPIRVWEPIGKEELKQKEQILAQFEQARLAFEVGKLEEGLYHLYPITKIDSVAAAYAFRMERDLKTYGPKPDGQWSPMWKLGEK